MKKYKEETELVSTYDTTICDGCGLDGPAYFIEVIIMVNQSEEGGGIDEYDFCDPCFMERVDLFKAAGSTAFLVTGEENSEQMDDEVL